MGAGKTSVGQRVAALTGLDFFDLDQEIERDAAMTVAEIFDREGEEGFRKRESAHLARLCDSQSAVIALGGGAFAQPDNAAKVRASGALVVFLDAPAAELRRRIAPQAHTRPLASDEKRFYALYEARRAAYAEADVRIDTSGKSIDEVAQQMLEELGHMFR